MYGDICTDTAIDPEIVKEVRTLLAGNEHLLRAVAPELMDRGTVSSAELLELMENAHVKER